MQKVKGSQMKFKNLDFRNAIRSRNGSKIDGLEKALAMRSKKRRVVPQTWAGDCRVQRKQLTAPLDEQRNLLRKHAAMCLGLYLPTGLWIWGWEGQGFAKSTTNEKFKRVSDKRKKDWKN